MSYLWHFGQDFYQTYARITGNRPLVFGTDIPPTSRGHTSGLGGFKNGV